MYGPGVVIDPNSKFGGLSIFDPGEGESTVSFGVHVNLGFVIKGVSDNKPDWSILTNSNTVTLTSALAASGKKNDTMYFKMPVPGCVKLPCVPEPPPVRVEPVTQCYQFTAENNPGCDNATRQTWAIRFNPVNKCEVEVWAAYDDPDNNIMWDCDSVMDADEDGYIDGGDTDFNGEIDEYEDEDQGNHLDGSPLEMLEYNGKEVSSYLSVDECDTGWLRALDEDLCNERCYKIAGRLYCR